MHNPFKDIKSEEVPENLKDKVMSSVHSAKFFLDLAELFSINYFSSISNLFKSSDKGSKDNNDNSTDL